MIRTCCIPGCGNTIHACFGTTLAGDMLRCWSGEIPITAVREFCEYCATQIVLFLDFGHLLAPERGAQVRAKIAWWLSAQ